MIWGCPLAACALAWGVPLTHSCVNSSILGNSTSTSPPVRKLLSYKEYTLPYYANAVQPLNTGGLSGPLRPDGGSSLERYLADWSERVQQVRDSQPDWVPPLMTLSPLLTELVRWDAYYQQSGNGARVLNLGAGKGLFLVPTSSNEVDIGLPSYEERRDVAPRFRLDRLSVPAHQATLQYRVLRAIWPELEVNWTHWLDGTQRGGVNQVFLTSGVIVSSIPVTSSLRTTVGIGYQFAVAPAQTLKPVQTPTYKNNVVLTARLLF